VRQNVERGVLFHILIVGALFCNIATLGTFSALLLCNLLATHFDGISSEYSSFPTTSVVKCTRKRTDCPRGSVLVIQTSPENIAPSL